METKVMGFFSRRPGVTLSDLAQHSGRDKAQLARLVKGLRARSSSPKPTPPIGATCTCASPTKATTCSGRWATRRRA